MNSSRTEIATLGGGCFWCLEAVLSPLQGVEKIVSGYAGGHVASPSYRDVCTGDTGHAEVVQVTFDPQAISYHELLELFFAFHDPTTLNRQGADVGTQYRSVIFTHSPEQRQVAERVLHDLVEEEIFDAPIVTEIAPFTGFFPAEEYHQDYYRRNPDQPYCQAVIAPKVAKLRKRYQERLKSQSAAR